MTDQETIEQSIIGKRIVAVSWLPFASSEGACELEFITLEGGTKLSLWANDWEGVVVEIVEEDGNVNA